MATKKNAHPPWMLRFRSSTGFIIATVWTSCFTDYFLYAMIVPVMPTALSDRAGVPYEDREYWVSVLLMCEAAVALVCCPIFGYLVDVSRTRQYPFFLGLILLGGSMGMLSVAHAVWLFVVARLLQGGATAMVAVAGLALMTDTVEFNNLGQTIGYLGSAITLGFLLGPLLGGLVYNAAGYNAVFAMAFAIIGVDLVMRVAVIEKKVARRWISTGHEENGNGNGHVYSSGGGYHTFPGEFTEVEEDKGKFALLEIARQPRVLISLWALLVQGLLFSAFDATIPIFVESMYGWSPFEAGMTFLPSAITALFEPYFGYISDKYGNRIVTFTSFLLLSPPLICLHLVEHNGTAHKILLITLLTIIGALLNSAIPALFVETQQVLEDMERAEPGIFGRKGAVAQAFGIQTMAQFLGLFLGPLWGGFVTYRFGWKSMAWSLGVLAGVTAVPMLWLSGGPGSDTGDRESENEEEQERLLDS
ncbi:MFS transporter [Aspergillus chevalieri]|uniref:Major facilitator superfamily (MFS) profile domain-containing protein n=1 Tax=Aspergillus chevalieri TaxID=182096 RepID=A0A7R7VNM7_ASPCH|nr:uncharacterized protein ACHE_40567S [Aspergillus chevalieri]BCR88003.1 hypothetical protein ACHE_40567S [Aspergillus chevalieri]